MRTMPACLSPASKSFSQYVDNLDGHAVLLNLCCVWNHQLGLVLKTRYNEMEVDQQPTSRRCSHQTVIPAELVSRVIFIVYLIVTSACIARRPCTEQDVGCSEKERFTIELEFVQCLANPEYLQCRWFCWILHSHSFVSAA